MQFHAQVIAKRFSTSFYRSIAIALPLFLMSLPTVANIPADIELSTPAPRIKQRLHALQEFEQPLITDVAFIANGLKEASPYPPKDAAIELQQFYQNNHNRLSDTLASVQQLQNLTAGQLLQELQDIQLHHDNLRAQYLTYATGGTPLSYYAAMTALTYGAYNALTLHPIYATMSFLSAAAIYQIANMLFSQQQDNLRTGMRSLNVTMEDLEHRSMAYHSQLLQLRKALRQGRWQTLQNLAIQNHIPLRPPAYLPNQSSQHYHHELVMVNNVTNDIHALTDQLSTFLENLSESEIFVMTFGKAGQKTSQDNSYHLLRYQQAWYLGLPVTDQRGNETLHFLEFLDTTKLAHYFSTIARLSESSLFGYMSFHPGPVSRSYK